jgi:hypothetical protein
LRSAFAFKRRLAPLSHGIVDFDAEVSYGALDLGVTEEQLGGAQISGALVNQRRLGSTQCVRPIETRVKSDAGKPAR